MAHQFSSQSVWGWLVRHKADLLQFGWPFALFETFNWVYDKGFFPFALWFWGAFWGAVIPTIGALCINAFVFWLYDFMKVDWLKARAMRELADKENKTHLEKLLTWHYQPRTGFSERVRGELRFALLLVPIDPVIVAIYYRENHFQGLAWKDWFLLAKTTIVACVVWLCIVEPVVLLAHFIWQYLF